MLVHLSRIEGIEIPTMRQLTNFLAAIRNIKDKADSTGTGTYLCLNDFEKLFLAHKELPDDLDTMFIVDVSTSVLKEEGQLVLVFRIFFSTRRLLEFTQHVSDYN